MSQKSNEYLESLFTGIETIINKKLETVSYDMTIICTIVDDTNKKNGIYKVNKDSVVYTVYSDSDKYQNGDQVRVTVPMGDFSKKKFIDGKYSNGENSSPIAYVSPADTILNISGNIVPSGVSSSIVANGDEESIIIWNSKISENSTFTTMQNNGLYNSIIVQADFKTSLSSYNLVSGNYGLRIDLLLRPSLNSTVYARKTIDLDSSEMFGNPYAFSVYSPQAKVIKIDDMGIIDGIELSLYQNKNFVDSKYGKFTPIAQNIQNIFINNIVIGFGNDLINVTNKSVKIYTDNDPSFQYEGTDTTNTKNIGIMWINKDDFNNYIGFSDGVYDSDYDELEYLAKKEADARLLKAKEKKYVGHDEISLNLAANLDDAVEGIKNALNVVKNKIIPLLQNDMQTTSTNENSDKIVETLQTLVDKIKSQSKNIETYLGSDEGEKPSLWKGLKGQYKQVLTYGKSLQDKTIADLSWPTNSESCGRLWPNNYETNTINYKARNNYNQLIRLAFVGTNSWKHREANPDVDCMGISTYLTNYFSDTKLGKIVDETFPEWRDVYDSYRLRIEDFRKEMLGYIGKAEDEDYDKPFPASVLSSDNSDYVALIYYRKRTDFPEYKTPDLTEYDNKYCIYWYRYEPGYIPNENEKILNNDWRRLEPYTYIQTTVSAEEYKDLVLYIKDSKGIFKRATGDYDKKTVYYKRSVDNDGINVGLPGIYFYTEELKKPYKYRKTEVYNKDRKYYSYNSKTQEYVLQTPTPSKEDIENKKYYTRVCVNDDGKAVFAPRAAAGKGYLTRHLEHTLEQEKYKAVIFYNHSMYVSNELVFTNSSIIPVKATSTTGDILIFEHLENSKDSYQAYNINGYLNDASDEWKTRQLRCHYDGFKAKDNALVDGTLYWYVPGVNTMLLVDIDELNSKGFKISSDKSSYNFIEVKPRLKDSEDFNDGVYYKKNNKEKYVKATNFNANTTYYTKNYSQYCFYKTVKAKKIDNATEDTKEWDKWDYTNGDESGIDNRDFWYKIKPFCDVNANQNTITCNFVPVDDVNDKIAGTQGFTFSAFGTSGTQYTLVITSDGKSNSSSSKRFGKFKAELKNATGKLLEFDNFNLEWEGFRKMETEPYSESLATAFDYSFPQTTIKISTPKRNYGIIKASTNVTIDSTNEKGENKTRNVRLSTLFSVPYGSSNYYLEGPTQVVYDNLGQLNSNSFYDTPYVLRASKNITLNGESYKKDEIIRKKNGKNDVYWDILLSIKNENNQWRDPETKAEEKALKKIKDTFLPKLEGNRLIPSPMYIGDCDYGIVVRARIKNEGDEQATTLWRQPIILLQNKYASSMLNNWDGSYQINTDDGVIMSTMIGAGRKNSENQFEGVLMGDVTHGTGMATKTGIGLYGFSDGVQSFGFNIDGTAFIGKLNEGRITFNGTNALITSANFEKNKEGMQINLNTGTITAHNFKLESSMVKIDSNPPEGGAYFQIGNTGVNEAGEDNPYFIFDKYGNLSLRVSSFNLVEGTLGNPNLLNNTAPLEATATVVSKVLDDTTGTVTAAWQSSKGEDKNNDVVSAWSTTNEPTNIRAGYARGKKVIQIRNKPVVKIGHAAKDENGNLQGGAAGDSTKKEVFIRDYYVHDKGWVVLRCKDQEKREKIAKAMENACLNDYIGYDQDNRGNLLRLLKEMDPVDFDPSRITSEEPAETDCSALVKVCVSYAYGVETPAKTVTTDSLPGDLENTGDFKQLTDDMYCTTSDYLLRGDILCTPVKGHTAVVLTNGVKTEEYTKEYVKSLPSFLTTEYRAMYQSIDLDYNKEYTISGEYFTTRENGWNLNIALYDGSISSNDNRVVSENITMKTGKWTKFKLTVPYEKSGNNKSDKKRRTRFYIGFRPPRDNSDEVWFNDYDWVMLHHLKLEEGKNATSWNASEEDNSLNRLKVSISDDGTLKVVSNDETNFNGYITYTPKDEITTG